MAALASCAISIVTDAAQKAGMPMRDLVISARSERDADDPTRYASVELDFSMRGVSQAQAEDLVTEFRKNCPIYGTVSRGADLRIVVRVQD